MQILSDYLKNTDGGTPKDISEATGLNYGYVRNTLPKLVRQGTAKKEGRGIYIYKKINDNACNCDSYDNDDNDDNHSQDLPLSQVVIGDDKGCDNSKANKNKSINPIVTDVIDVTEDKGLFEKESVAI